MALKTPIPPNAAQFSIDVVGDKTGKTVKADFTSTQILSHRQQLVNDQLYREYVGGNPLYASEDTRQRAQILADINSALVSPVPQFWREKGLGLDLLDDNVIMEVWQGVQKVQADAAKEIREKAEKGVEKLKSAIASGSMQNETAEE